MNKRLHILIDANPLIGKKTGVGHFTLRFIEATAENNPDIDFTGYYFNFLGRKKNLCLPRNANISYKEIRFFPSKILSLLHRVGAQLPIEFFIGSKRFDFMLFTNFVSMPSIRRIPYAVTVHDLAYLDQPNYLQQGNRNYLLRFVPRSINKASFIITISNFTKERLRQHYGSAAANKTIVLPIPYEPANTQAPSSISKDVRSIIMSPYLLFVGTIEPRKNLENLVYGFSMTPKSFRKRYTLVLAGGLGWNNEKLFDAIAKTKAKANIKLIGYVSDHERDLLYKNARSICMLSHYEGFGMPALEAMQYKKPLVLSDIPVFHEIAKDYAIYCDRNNPEEIAQALIESTISRSKLPTHNYSWKVNSKVFINKVRRYVF